MTTTAKKNLPATKSAFLLLSNTERNEIRSAFYQAGDGVGALVRELDNVASQDPRLAELHAMFAKMEAMLNDSSIGALL